MRLIYFGDFSFNQVVFFSLLLFFCYILGHIDFFSIYKPSHTFSETQWRILLYIFHPEEIKRIYCNIIGCNFIKSLEWRTAERSRSFATKNHLIGNLNKLLTISYGNHRLRQIDCIQNQWHLLNASEAIYGLAFYNRFRIKRAKCYVQLKYAYRGKIEDRQFSMSCSYSSYFFFIKTTLSKIYKSFYLRIIVRRIFIYV